MINLTAEEIANIVVFFWSAAPVSKSFEQCKTVEEALIMAEILNSEEEERRYYKFLEALRKYVVEFLFVDIDYVGSITFKVDFAPSEAFNWLASAHKIDLPLLPADKTLLIVKQLVKCGGKDKVLKVTIQTRDGHKTLWRRKHYVLTDYPKF